MGRGNGNLHKLEMGRTGKKSGLGSVSSCGISKNLNNALADVFIYIIHGKQVKRNVSERSY